MDLAEYDQQIEEIVCLLTRTPPDLGVVRNLLDMRKMPCEALSKVARNIVDRFCFCEYRDAKGSEDCPPVLTKIDQEGNVIDEKLVSYYLQDILTLLLDHGMNPNDISGEDSDEENLMEMVKYVDYTDTAGRCMRLLMEHGGDPNLFIGNESLIYTIDIDVVFDIGYGYDLPSVVQCWLVLIGYGGRLDDGRLPVKMCEGYQPEVFKDFEKFSWRVSRMKPTPESPEGWCLHICEKDSGIEVALL